MTIHNPDHPAIQSLMSAKQIVLDQKNIERLTGIYFLLLSDVIVYVGQTQNLHARLAQHVRVKEFDAYSFERCRTEHLDRREAAYIEALRPSMNVSRPKILHNDFPPPISLDEMKRRIINRQA